MRILLVEDSKYEILAIRRALTKEGLAAEIDACPRAEDALARLRDQAGGFDLLLTDYRLPGMSGLELCRAVREEQIPLPIVMLTGAGSEHLAIEALKAGVDEYLIKDSHETHLRLLSVLLPEVLARHQDRIARRRAEASLRYLAAIVESSNDAIIGETLEGVIVSWNPAAQRIYGYEAGEAIGQPLSILSPVGEEEEMTAFLARLRRGERVERYETVHRRRDGIPVDVSLSLSPILDESGEVAGVSTIARDITHRKRTERALELARQQADAANRAKSELLASMSHEIRTPMTAILGFADLLLQDEPPGSASPERRQHLRTIQDNGQYLLELLGDMLDLSRIESGKLGVTRRRCSLPGLLAEVVSLMGVRSREKGLALELESSGPVPETIETDPVRLRQILINLLGNAIKFTEVGRVRLEVRLLPPEAGEPRLELAVCDTGVGIDSAWMPRLFEPFSQADAAASRGVGLGLSISERLAVLLGGGITVESEPGRGSTFRVTTATGPLAGVPRVDDVTRWARRQRPAPVLPTALDGRLLLVEDNPVNQLLVSSYLKAAGAEVVVAENGQVALDLALAAEAEQPFGLVLMDIQMPVLDGYEATRRLRAEGFRRPIVALTAHAMESHRERCLEAGCDGYLSKPIDRDEMFRLIAELLG